MMDFQTGITPLEIESHLEDSSSGTLLHAFGATPMRAHARSRGGREIATETLPTAMVANWTKLKSSALSAQFYSRLLRLASDRFSSAAPHATTAERLRPSSLSDFLDIWSTIKSDAVEPEISLSTDGSLIAEWFKSPDQHLDIKFGRSAVMFGLFNRGHIIEGAEGKDLVVAILRNHSAKPFQWRAAG
jgi:hypothetical protein